MTALGICKVEFYKSNRLLFSIAGETETYKTFIKTDPQTVLINKAYFMSLVRNMILPYDTNDWNKWLKAATQGSEKPFFLTSRSAKMLTKTVESWSPAVIIKNPTKLGDAEFIRYCQETFKKAQISVTPYQVIFK